MDGRITNNFEAIVLGRDHEIVMLLFTNYRYLICKS